MMKIIKTHGSAPLNKVDEIASARAILASERVGERERGGGGARELFRRTRMEDAMYCT